MCLEPTAAAAAAGVISPRYVLRARVASHFALAFYSARYKSDWEGQTYEGKHLQVHDENYEETRLKRGPMGRAPLNFLRNCCWRLEENRVFCFLEGFQVLISLVKMNLR